MKKSDSRPIRNPFYEDIRRNGIIVDVQRTAVSSRSSLRPYYARVRTASGLHASPLGRPKRGEIRQPTTIRSVRLPVKLWELVRAQARRERISLNAAMHQAAQIWLRS
jgi:hypothetical protein